MALYLLELIIAMLSLIPLAVNQNIGRQIYKSWYLKIHSKFSVKLSNETKLDPLINLALNFRKWLEMFNFVSMEAVIFLLLPCVCWAWIYSIISVVIVRIMLGYVYAILPIYKYTHVHDLMFCFLCFIFIMFLASGMLTHLSLICWCLFTVCLPQPCTYGNLMEVFGCFGQCDPMSLITAWQARDRYWTEYNENGFLSDSLCKGIITTKCESVLVK